MFKETKRINQLKELWQWFKPQNKVSHIRFQPLNFDFYIREANFSDFTETFVAFLLGHDC